MLFFILILTTQLLGETVEAKKAYMSLALERGEIATFHLGNFTQEVTLKALRKDRIHVFCEKRLYVGQGADPCEEIAIDISGKLTCGEEYLNYFSTSPFVLISSKFQYERDVKCYAVTTPQMKEINLRVEDGVYRLEDQGNYLEDFNEGWKFKTTPGTRLSIQCSISTTSYQNQNVCTDAVITIFNGEEEIRLCGIKDPVIISKNTEIHLIIQVLKSRSGNYACDVQTITGPSPNQEENLMVEDSPEDAGAGRRGFTCECGRRNRGRKINRILFGRDTTEGEYPWMVAVRNPSNSHRCGGSIITPYHVLTAAHCMIDYKVRKKYEIYDTVVYVGAYDLKDASHGKTKGVAVKRTFIPEEYWEFKKHYDIAVLYLAEKVEFNEFVGPVCLNRSPPKLINKAVKALGWGLTETGRPAPRLMETKLFVKPPSKCYFSEYMICTHNKDSSTCYVCVLHVFELGDLPRGCHLVYYLPGRTLQFCGQSVPEMVAEQEDPMCEPGAFFIAYLTTLKFFSY